MLFGFATSYTWTIRLLIALFALISTTVVTDVRAQDSVDFNADLTVTTDYIYRGISQTMSSPALQVCFEASHGSGFFAYLWGSNVDFVADGNPDDGARVEVDAALGYSRELTDRIAATVSWTQFAYPGTVEMIDYNYSEWAASIVLDERHGIAVSYSPNVFASESPGLYVAATTSVELLAGIALFAELGHYNLNNAYGESYVHGTLGLSGGSEFIGWQLSYHVVEQRAKQIFEPSTVQPAMVLTVNLSF